MGVTVSEKWQGEHTLLITVDAISKSSVTKLSNVMETSRV